MTFKVCSWHHVWAVHVHSPVVGYGDTKERFDTFNSITNLESIVIVHCQYRVQLISRYSCYNKYILTVMYVSDLTNVTLKYILNGC